MTKSVQVFCMLIVLLALFGIAIITAPEDKSEQYKQARESDKQIKALAFKRCIESTKHEDYECYLMFNLGE